MYLKGRACVWMEPKHLGHLVRRKGGCRKRTQDIDWNDTPYYAHGHGAHACCKDAALTNECPNSTDVRASRWCGVPAGGRQRVPLPQDARVVAHVQKGHKAPPVPVIRHAATVVDVPRDEAESVPGYLHITERTKQVEDTWSLDTRRASEWKVNHRRQPCPNQAPMYFSPTSALL